MLKSLREARQSKIGQGLGMINPYHLEVSIANGIGLLDASVTDLPPLSSVSR